MSRNRLFVVEQAGRIRIIDRGRLLARPFLDITGEVKSGKVVYAYPEDQKKASEVRVKK